MNRLTFIKIKHPDGSFGVTLQEPITEQEAEKIAHKLNRALELVGCL